MSNLISNKLLSLETAKKMVGHPIIKAKELGVVRAIAVVENGGHLVCLERMDETMVAAANIAIGKAATAVGFKRSGIILKQTVTENRVVMQTLIGVIPAPFIHLMGASD